MTHQQHQKHQPGVGTMAPPFPRVEAFSGEVPIYCVTPHEGRCIHRFFDTSPISPSGRYLAVFRMPQEERTPRPGERGEILVIDLATGEEHRVATTAGWESQMGANLNWGANDDILIFNDVDTRDWSIHGVKLHWQSARAEFFDQGVYHVSPDGRYAVCADLTAVRRTQTGYGVMIPDERVPEYHGISEKNGIWITDLDTLQTSMLISAAETVERAVPKAEWDDYAHRENYFFHTKWSPKGTHLMFSLRGYAAENAKPFSNMSPAMRYDVFTMRPDKSELYDTLPQAVWRNLGHHTNWCPDGEHLSLNLAIDGGAVVKFCFVDRDGGNLHKLCDEPIGSGHPTLHPSGKFLVTDAYEFETLCRPDGCTPLRLIDIHTLRTTVLAWLPVAIPQARLRSDVGLRVDPHPAWDRTWRYLVFNAYAQGTRRVYLADMSRFTDTDF